MDPSQFGPAIKQICEEKGISEDAVIETIEAAMASAYRKDYGEADWKIKAEFDIKTGNTKFFRVFDVVKEVENEENQISIKDANKKEAGKVSKVSKVSKVAKDKAKKKSSKVAKSSKPKTKKYKEDDQILEELEQPEDYGRIAAQTAKQVVIQRIREAERDVIYEEFKDKEGEVINGVVQQLEGRNVIVDLGKANGVLFPTEQIPQEKYYIGQRLKVYIVAVEKTSKAPLINLSRAHEGLIKKLFELEVPEINAKAVEIKGIAREAGRRTKMAVAAHQEGVDPVGSCVGQRGTRVQAVLAEIGDEKIDIIEYQKESEKYIEAALSPAKIIEVKINKSKKTAKVKVDVEQLSLAIGKEGQNVRLASKLTGFEIDVEKGESAKRGPEIAGKTVKDETAKVKKLAAVKEGAKLTKSSKAKKSIKVGKVSKVSKVKKVEEKKTKKVSKTDKPDKESAKKTVKKNE